jgi:hypothetical protein
MGGGAGGGAEGGGGVDAAAVSRRCCDAFIARSAAESCWNWPTRCSRQPSMGTKCCCSWGEGGRSSRIVSTRVLWPFTVDCTVTGTETNSWSYEGAGDLEWRAESRGCPDVAASPWLELLLATREAEGWSLCCRRTDFACSRSGQWRDSKEGELGGRGEGGDEEP